MSAHLESRAAWGPDIVKISRDEIGMVMFLCMSRIQTTGESHLLAQMTNRPLQTMRLWTCSQSNQAQSKPAMDSCRSPCKNGGKRIGFPASIDLCDWPIRPMTWGLVQSCQDRNSRVRKRPVLSQAFYAAAYTHLRHLSNQTNQRLYADSPHELAFSVSNFALTQSNFRTDQHRIFAGSETVWSWWIAWEIGFCFFLFDVILKQKHQKYFQSDMIKRWNITRGYAIRNIDLRITRAFWGGHLQEITERQTTESAFHHKAGCIRSTCEEIKTLRYIGALVESRRTVGHIDRGLNAARGFGQPQFQILFGTQFQNSGLVIWSRMGTLNCTVQEKCTMKFVLKESTKSCTKRCTLICTLTPGGRSHLLARTKDFPSPWTALLVLAGSGRRLIRGV